MQDNRTKKNTWRYVGFLLLPVSAFLDDGMVYLTIAAEKGGAR